MSVCLVPEKIVTAVYKILKVNYFDRPCIAWNTAISSLSTPPAALSAIT